MTHRQNPQIAAIRKRAIRLLARREHSLYELTTKLAAHFEPELIAQTLTQLVHEGLQSDQRFTESFIHTCYNRGKGPLWIHQALQQRRVDTALIDTMINDTDEKWAHLAAIVYQKKFANQPLGNHQDKAKRLRFMEQRGFSYELTQQIMAF